MSGERTGGAVDIPSVASPMTLKVRFADADSLCVYDEGDLESVVLNIVADVCV